MMRVLLVDDEAPARERLKRLLADTPSIEVAIEVVGEASNGIEALEKISELKPDVVFLDIEMPALNGLETAEAISENGPAVVFVTAYDEHALRAFEANALDYVVKPVSSQRLEAAIGKLKKWLAPPSRAAVAAASDSGRIAIKSGSKFHVVRAEEISAVVSQDGYSALIVGAHEILSEDSLETFEARLKPFGFIRVHRGALINATFLHQLHREGDRKFDAVLSDEKKSRIPISRERLKGVMDLIGARKKNQNLFV